MAGCHALLIHLPHCHQSRSRQWQDQWRRLEPLLRRGERCDGRLNNVRMWMQSWLTVTLSHICGEQFTGSLSIRVLL